MEVTVVATPERTQRTTISPQRIKSILLYDGWHEVQEASFTVLEFEGMSSSPSSSAERALTYKSSKDGEVTVPVSQISGYKQQS